MKKKLLTNKKQNGKDFRYETGKQDTIYDAFGSFR
jgi:hypothetical protein